MVRPLVFLVVVGLLAGACGSAARPGAPPGAAAAAAPAAWAGVQPDAFFEPEPFHKGLEAALRSPPHRGEGRLAGGVAPHHALAGHMLSHLFIELGERAPRTVIVVGPNHEHKGQRILTGRRDWATPFGVVATDLELVDRLAAAGLAVVDDESLTAEHSIGALMPYLKFHAPGATVVPIVLHRDVSIAEQRTLARALAPLLGPDRLLVASVDFSHYLTRAEAEAKDEVTLAAILAFDLERLMRMGPDHLDSPGSLGVLMLTMRELGAAGPEVAAHTNSGIILGSDSIETTSYFTLKYRAAE